MNSELDFSTVEIKEVPVVSPDGKHYTLREASGKTAKDHRNGLLASTQFAQNDDGSYKAIGLSETASLESKFVAGCLWNESGKNPSYITVEGWPDRVQRKLYRKAKEISEVLERDVTASYLRKALALEAAPISIDDLKAWVDSLSDDFNYLKRALKEEDEVVEEEEEEAKNLPSATTNGSL